MTAANDLTDTARSQASGWLAALGRANRPPELEARFRSWLDADGSNRAAFDASTRVWELLVPAGRAFRADRRRREVARNVAIAATAACLVAAVGVGAGVVSQTLKRRRLSAA